MKRPCLSVTTTGSTTSSADALRKTGDGCAWRSAARKRQSRTQKARTAETKGSRILLPSCLPTFPSCRPAFLPSIGSSVRQRRSARMANPPASESPLSSSYSARPLAVRGRWRRVAPEVPVAPADAVLVWFAAVRLERFDAVVLFARSDVFDAAVFAPAVFDAAVLDAVAFERSEVVVCDAAVRLAAGRSLFTATFSFELCQVPFSSKYPSSAVFIGSGISPAVVEELPSSLYASTRWCVSFAMRIAWLFGYTNSSPIRSPG